MLLKDVDERGLAEAAAALPIEKHAAALQAHEDFLAEVTDVAREVTTLDGDAAPDAVTGWLSRD